jgi:hypothetical protein
MPDKIEESTRRQIAEFLPAAIERTLESYREFSGRDAGGDSKAFNAHHAACKVAVAHIELLIKLAKWADLADADKTQGADATLAAMMKDAAEEVGGYREKLEGTCQDDRC